MRNPHSRTRVEASDFDLYHRFPFEHHTHRQHEHTRNVKSKNRLLGDLSTVNRENSLVFLYSQGMLSAI